MVYMYICRHVYIYRHIYICIYIYVYIYVYVDIYIYISLVDKIDILPFYSLMSTVGAVYQLTKGWVQMPRPGFNAGHSAAALLDQAGYAFLFTELVASTSSTSNIPIAGYISYTVI